MNRLSMAGITAFMILAAAFFFPMQAVFASDLETGADTERVDAPIHPDEYISDDTFTDAKDEPQIEPMILSLYDGNMTAADVLEIYSVWLDRPYTVYFLETGGDVRELSLDTSASAEYDRFGSVKCEISWRYDDFDNKTPGRRMIIGDVLLPLGYVFEDGIPLTVQSPVIVYDPNGEPTETVVSCTYTKGGLGIPILIPLGTERDVLEDYFSNLAETADIVTGNDDEFSAKVTLDLNAIDTQTAGVYYPIVLDLPACVAFDDQKFYMIGVHVLPADEVDLRAVSHSRRAYRVSWLYPIQSGPETSLWVSVDRGDWHQYSAELPSNDYVNFYIVGQNRFFTEMEIRHAAIPVGHIYEFQLQYDGDRFSNILEIDLISNSLPHTRPGEGDRHGYDRMPGIGQTPPENEDGRGGNLDPVDKGISRPDWSGGNKSKLPGDDNGDAERYGEDPPAAGQGDSIDTSGGERNDPSGGDGDGSDNPEHQNQDNSDTENVQGDSTNTPGGERSGPFGGDGDGGSRDSVMLVSTVIAEEPSPVTQLDTVASPLLDSPREPQIPKLDAPTYKLPYIPAAHTETSVTPAPLPMTLPLILGSVTGLSCAGLVLLKKRREF